MERRDGYRTQGVWLLVGLGALGICRGVPRLFSAPFAVCVAGDVLGFVLLAVAVVTGVVRGVRLGRGRGAHSPRRPVG
jgi:hypothetical protein